MELNEFEAEPQKTYGLNQVIFVSLISAFLGGGLVVGYFIMNSTKIFSNINVFPATDTAPNSNEEPSGGSKTTTITYSEPSPEELQKLK